MNPITDIVFSLTWILLFAFAIRSIVRGWTMMREDTARPNGMWTTQVRRPTHPEMVDVKPGDELMGVTFAKIPPPTSDPLHESLRKRITELTPDPWIDEEDDDDGGAPVPARR